MCGYSEYRGNRPRHAADWWLEEFDNEIVLYHPVKTQAVYLNETAALIWRLCDGDRDMLEIARLVQGAYPQALSGLVEQIDETIKRFASLGAVEFP